MAKPNEICPVCKEKFLPHETALFFSGRCNLAKVYVDDTFYLVHHHCVEEFKTHGELVKRLSDGKKDNSYLEE
jgi:hypothetical protein